MQPVTGLDWLDLSYSIKEYGLPPDFFKRCKEAQIQSRNTEFGKDPGIVELPPIRYGEPPIKLFLKRFTGEYSDYILYNNDLEIKINENPNSGQKYPDLFIHPSNQYLWRYYWFDQVEILDRWIHSLFNVTEYHVTRCDLCMDTNDPLPEFLPDLRDIVTKGKSKRPYNLINPTYGLTRTGIMIGKDTIVGRIYPKDFEITLTHKEWMRDMWKESGWNGTDPITRSEFQLRRNCLREMIPAINTPQDLEINASGIWIYATEWLTLRKPNSDKRSRRWPLTEYWKRIQANAGYFGKMSYIEREKQRNPTIKMLLDQAIGCIATAQALGLENPLEEITKLMETEEYQDKLNKRKLFYIPFNLN